MKKICFVTSARSEYGLIKWLMNEVDKSASFQLQLVVTGAHLLQDQGHTIDAIVDDGFSIDEVVDVHPDSSSKMKIAESMGIMAQKLSEAFDRLSPDYLVVLGDRYELLPIVNTAFVMSIPIIHISGGDVTEGAIDDGIRNAVTMLSEYHFPGTKESAENIVRMKGNDRNVWCVGEPGLDAFYKEILLSRDELAGGLGIDPDKKWVLFTYHPETKRDGEYNLDVVKNCMDSLLGIDGLQVVATYSNTDYGGTEINRYLEEVGKNNLGSLKIVPSLGNKRYLSFMKQAAFVMGNSSSGIVEAPMLGVLAINIGNRQKGRHLCANVIQTSGTKSSIEEAIGNALKLQHTDSDYYWGDGHTAESIVRILEKELG